MNSASDRLESALKRTVSDDGIRHLAGCHLLPAVGLAILLAILVLQAGRAWRYFPMFMGDQGWYLRAALRVSRGEILYRDVAWAYGPLPAQALAEVKRFSLPHASVGV